MSERRRTSPEPEDGPDDAGTSGTSPRTVLMAAILTGVSAVVVSLITGLGTSLQGLVTDTLFGEDEPAASASPNPAPPASGSAAPESKPAPPPADGADPVAVAVLPGESSSWLVSEQRVSPEDRAVLTGPNDPVRLEQLLRRIDVVSLNATSYKLSVTNASASTVRVVDIVPVITKRTAAIDTTLIEPLGGMADDTIPAELDLNDRNPVFTENGKAYFDYTTQVLKPGESFVMAVESKLTDREYVEYHLRLDYIDDRGKKHSLQVNEDPESPRHVFHVSGAVDDDEYTDYWGPAANGQAWKLKSGGGKG